MPRLNRKPSNSRVAARPPRTGAFSKRVTPTPSRARKQAAVRPAIPPPTTATSVCANLGSIPAYSFPSANEGTMRLDRRSHPHDAGHAPARDMGRASLCSVTDHRARAPGRLPRSRELLELDATWLDGQPGHDTRRRPLATVVGLLVVVVLKMLLSVSRVMNFRGS